MTSVVTLDIRPVLAAGREPFPDIMQAADRLPAKNTLRLIAPFRPVPLLAVMERRGFTWIERPLDGQDWQIDFSRAIEALGTGSSLDAADWPAPVRLLDVTGLEPPEQTTRILAALDAAAPGEVVFALIEREPLFLLPQLQAAGHRWVGNHAADGSGYRILVRRGGDG